jgi:hypothetical protein
VTVLAQPAGQTCAVANGSGTIAGSNVTNVAVSCTTNPVYTVSGTISGLSGAVTLQDNGGDNLTASANGLFTFLTGLQNGSSYSVTVLAQPSGQTCAVANGSGTVSAANVTNVAVNCTVNGFNTVGGTVSGLSGVVTLQDNGGDNLDVGANGAFTFATALASGSAYAVTILTQPFFQTCTVANASGVIAGANVTDVAVSCLTTGGFFTGYCEVDPVTGLLTGACWDPGNCFDGLSPYCSGPPLNPVVQPFCGPLLDSTFCIF